MAYRDDITTGAAIINVPFTEQRRYAPLIFSMYTELPYQTLGCS